MKKTVISWIESTLELSAVMVLYFSGTGNSRFVAQLIAKLCNDELKSINKMLRTRRLDPFNAQYAFESNRPFVIVCPTYCWHLPQVVEDFLLDSRFLGSHDMYFFLTCGGSTGNAEDHARQICTKLEMNFRGLASTQMPENYITLFKAPEADEAVAIIRAAIPQVESVARLIASDRDISDSNAGNGVPAFVRSLFYRFFIHDRRFRVKNNCTGCTTCAKLCPMVNIRMRNGKPTWNGRCIQCQSCISVCPVNAIEFGTWTLRKRRYYLYADGRQKFPLERQDDDYFPD